MSIKLRITVMSGVDDGKQFVLVLGKDGVLQDHAWSLSIGRSDNNALWLRNDTFTSRSHAILSWRDGLWWLEDKNSTNGSFIENPHDFFDDLRIIGLVQIEISRMIRIGRTWLWLQMETL